MIHGQTKLLDTRKVTQLKIYFVKSVKQAANTRQLGLFQPVIVADADEDGRFGKGPVSLFSSIPFPRFRGYLSFCCCCCCCCCFSFYYLAWLVDDDACVRLVFVRHAPLGKENIWMLLLVVFLLQLLLCLSCFCYHHHHYHYFLRHYHGCCCYHNHRHYCHRHDHCHGASCYVVFAVAVVVMEVVVVVVVVVD